MDGRKRKKNTGGVSLNMINYSCYFLFICCYGDGGGGGGGRKLPPLTTLP